MPTRVRTIEDFLRQFGGKESTRDHYGTVLQIEERLLRKPLAQATEDDIANLKEKRLRKMLSGAQVAKVLRMFFKKAGRKRLVEILALRETKRKIRREDILTRTEVQAMLDTGANSGRDRAIIAMLYELGVRVDSLLAVKVRDVKWEDMPENGGRKKFTIWIGKVKEDGLQHSGYVVELAQFLVEWLEEHPDAHNDDAPLFPTGRGNGMPLGERGCLDLVKKAYHRAHCRGLPHTWKDHSRPDGEEAPPEGPRPKRIWNHLFRHTRATHLIVLGVHPAMIKKMLGWKPSSHVLEDRYMHLVDRDAENSYLGALGLKVEEKEKLEALTYDPERLRPVLALVPVPGERGPRTVKGEIQEAIARERERIRAEVAGGLEEWVKQQYRGDPAWWTPERVAAASAKDGEGVRAIRRETVAHATEITQERAVAEDDVKRGDLVAALDRMERQRREDLEFFAAMRARLAKIESG